MTAGQEAQPAYGEILRLTELLETTHVQDGTPDLMFFLVTHQVCEMWFALILKHLDVAADALLGDDPVAATEQLGRLPALVAILIAQFDALTTLAPASFEEIRTELGSASGFQSAQFREIEYRCGLRDTRFLNTSGFTEQERDRLRKRLAQTSVADAYERLVKRRAELPEPDGESTGVRSALLAFDEAFVTWRARHASLAERFLGGRTGTGGSDGPSYLWRAAGRRLFPAVWGPA
jgi:tryptophan 2,3-dioxygenase